ncbi:MAG: hypothetical protein NTW28_03455, partial [Candidatus Solibacter sp.]|nr:hypothetical protein [Candidatus Solibacter sp.]
LAVTAQAVIYSPLGARLSLMSGNSNPAVRFSDPLPGVVNSFTGADSRKWVTGIARYSTATVAGVYPGIDFQYVMGADGELKLRMLARAGAALTPVVFEIEKAVSMTISNGVLTARLGPSRLDPQLSYLAPVAFQDGPAGRVSRAVSYTLQSATRFGLAIQGHDPNLPLQIEMRVDTSTLGAPPFTTGPIQIADAAGNTFVAASVPDVAGKDAPFPADKWEGCGAGPTLPYACIDVAVYKFSKAGDLVFVSYLAGRTREFANFLRLAPDGALVLTGGTDSADFPVTTAALQTAYGGPAALPIGSSQPAAGDFFAARFDATTGLLRAATFLGGPGADSIGETALGPDGSLYLLPKLLVGGFSAGLPVSLGALQSACPGDPCQNGYAAHLSPNLDRLLYGTYLPGFVQTTARLHSDGSVYYAGNAGPGFPVTPTAYRQQPTGDTDGIVARLDPTGSKLLFATYLGGRYSDWILRMAVAPDGSSWVGLTSFEQCCVDVEHRLIHLDANGERILVDKPFAADDLAVDRGGNLIAMTYGDFAVGPDAFLASACIGNFQAYVKLNPQGEQLFATYLPAGTGYGFAGTSDRGLPELSIAGELFEVVEGQDMGVFAGCVVDAAAFSNPETLSPGAIVTLFGSHLGPLQPVSFQLVNGRVPLSLGGTQVLVNGEPAPILFSSYWQLNVILPTSLQLPTKPTIQVVNTGSAGNELHNSVVQQAGLSLFRLDGSPSRPAAALNEDGTVNSPRNPAKRGSRVVLFGTGGGATIPPGTAGEVTPLAPRPLENGARVEIAGGPMLTVEYSGAAPGAVAGATQINVKLPDAIPEVAGFPRGTLPLRVSTPGVLFYSGYVTVAVNTN